MTLSLKAGTALAGCLLLAGVVLASAPAGHAQQSSASCPAGNGGITLPPGFCATVFAVNLGHPRQMVVAPDGVLYVNTWSGIYYRNGPVPPGGMLVALKAGGGGDKADQIVRFGPSHAQGDHGGTGIGFYDGYIYAEANDRIVRYKLPPDGIAPTEPAETVVSGLPTSGDHPMHPLAIDSQGHMYVDLGSATNSCQSQNRIPEVPGQQPCTELHTRGGQWLFDAGKTGQVFSPAQRYATGIRNSEGISFDSQGRVFVTQHGRDQLFENWMQYYNAEQGAQEPAEELLQLTRGGDYGWPYCYYDYDQKKLVLAPEYGGDGGHKVGVCAQKLEPVAAFPGHWAPNDMKIYEGSSFPTAYKDGAFIAFHGSWNRAPLPQAGYNVVFQPLHDGKASGPFVIFANGFAGRYMDPGAAAHRPTGIAFAPDGSMYISDDQGGTIWHVTYQGGNRDSAIAAAAPVPALPQALANGNAVPPEGMHPTAGLPIPPGGSPDQVALGDRIFHGQAANGTCAGCHGRDAKGTSAGSDLADGKWVWSGGTVQGIVDTIEHGVPKPKDHIGNMPPDGGVRLSQADVQAVADYVWAISHEGGK